MSEARRIGELLPPLLVRARRLALIGALVETYETAVERKAIIIALHERGIISGEAVALLLQHFELESA